MPWACLSFHLYVFYQHIWTHCTQCLCVCMHVKVVMMHEIRHGWCWAVMNGCLVVSHRGYTVGCSNTNHSVTLLCGPRGVGVQHNDIKCRCGGPSPEQKHTSVYGMKYFCKERFSAHKQGHALLPPPLAIALSCLSAWQVIVKCGHREERWRGEGEGTDGFHTVHGQPGDLLAPGGITTDHHH